MIIEKKRESILFIAATYVITWLCWGTLALFEIPAKSSVFSVALYMLGGFATIIVALLLPLFVRKEERSSYYKRFFNFKVSFKWYLLPIIPVLFMVFIPYGLVSVFFKTAAEALNIQPLYMVLPLFAFMIIGGGIEELGWRGILVHNLRKTNPVIVSLVIGLIWCCWHIPLFFIKGVGQYHTSFIPYFITVIAYSFITTIVYIKTNSVVPCIIVHALINAFGNMGFIYGNDLTATYVDSVVRLAVAIVFFLIMNRGNQIHKQAGRAAIFSTNT